MSKTPTVFGEGFESFEEATDTLLDTIYNDDMNKNNRFTFNFEYDINDFYLDAVDGADDIFFQKRYFERYSESLACSNDFVMGGSKLASFDILKKTMAPLTNDGGVMKEIMKKGFGKLPESPDVKIYFHYSIFLEGSKEPLDSTAMRRELQVIGGDDSEPVLYGIELAVRSMEYGEVAKFVHSSDYFYGKMGCPPKIPPASSALCFIEVVDIQEPKDKPIPFHTMTTDEHQKLTFSKMQEELATLKEAGNQKFYQKDYYAAAERYRIGIKIIATYRCSEPDDEATIDKIAYKYLTNLLLCYRKMGVWNKIIRLSKSVLKVGRPQTRNEKLHFNYALALFKKDDLAEALNIIEKGMKAHPFSSELNDLHAQITKEQDKQKKIQDGVGKSHDAIMKDGLFAK